MDRRGALLRWCCGVWALLALAWPGGEAAAERLRVEGGTFAPFFAEPDAPAVRVASFWLDRGPVTQAEFARFVESHPAWAPGGPPAIFADEGYLRSWAGRLAASIQAGDALGDQPVTWVSWFAASAYCAAAGGRLPSEAEWELAASARSEAERDAQTQLLLRWYSQPGRVGLRRVGEQGADARGFYDLHGLVWEWVFDFNASMVAGARRGAEERITGLFCGGASVSARDPRDYAAFMRYAMRSSLTGRYTARNVGFRCAYDDEVMR